MAVLLAFTVLVGHVVSDGMAPEPVVIPSPPPVEAAAWIVYDVGAGCVIDSRNAAEARPMASTTKLMTALLALEHTSSGDEVVISRRAQATNHKQIYLRAGDRWRADELLEAAVVVSANDAAVALAEHVAGDVESFVDMMNAKAALLGLDDTSYVNPHGLDAPGHLTSARDLLVLSRMLMAIPAFTELAGRREAVLTADGKRPQRRESTNELLEQVPGVIGVKTGKTRGAGDVLSAAVDRAGRRMYVVVMGSPDANIDVRALIEYGFEAAVPERRALRPVDTGLVNCVTAGSYTAGGERGTRE